ncbi:MAG TPA: hypothetical protein VER11_34600 [Polyangiaceae bacterium]|nr:hypothetical protein [Polyangiaceae bacterium]
MELGLKQNLFRLAVTNTDDGGQLAVERAPQHGNRRRRVTKSGLASLEANRIGAELEQPFELELFER